MQALKHGTAVLAMVLFFAGFIALLAWDRDHAEAQAHCPSYYNAVYGCSAPLSEGGR